MVLPKVEEHDELYRGVVRQFEQHLDTHEAERSTHGKGLWLLESRQPSTRYCRRRLEELVHSL
jgi:hypothetical protein